MREETSKFEKFFKENYQKFYIYALHILNDEEACRDIVADVMEYACRNFEQHDERQWFNYSVSSIRNKCLDHMRRKAVHKKYADFYTYVVEHKETMEPHEEDERLTPGQDAKLNDDGSLGVAEVDIESYLYWRDGYFYFDDISLENIMQDVGRWYNLNVVFQNADARNYHMHFLADKRGGIDHVVKLLNSMGKVTVTLKDNTLMVR